MAIAVAVYVEDIDTQIATYNQIRLYRASSPDGTFSLTGDVATLVADQEQYALTDASGDANQYYQYDFYHTVSTAASAKSEVFSPPEATLLKVMLKAAQESGAGFSSTCTATGDTTYLVDAKLNDDGLDEDFLEGAWVYMYGASAANKLRRVTTFTTATSRLTWARASVALNSGDPYHVYTLLPPIPTPGQAYSWRDAVNDGLNATWYIDLLNIGPGTSTQPSRFDLSSFQLPRDSVRRVFLRTYDDDDRPYDEDMNMRGNWWSIEENGPQEMTLILSRPPGTTEHVFVEVQRTYAAIYTDDAVTVCPFELAWRAAKWKAYEHLNAIQLGKYAGEMTLARKAFVTEYARYRPQNAVIL